MSQANPTTEAPVHEMPERKSRLWLWIKIPAGIILAFAAFELMFLAWFWLVPDWSGMREGKTPESALIKDYLSKREDDPKLPPLRWKPISKPVPKSISKVFLFAEDSRFYEHDGFDYEAIAAAMEYNWKKGKVLRGASTISQQTAKNMFLSLSRNPLRKWHEVLLTYMLEAKLEKSEILQTYLNVAEFGTGIYGIEAAAQAYFHRSASSLSQEQAIQLAASLPSPKKHNPRSMTKVFQKRSRRVATAIRMVDQYAIGKKDTGASSALPTSAELAEKLREVMAEPAAESKELSGEELEAETSKTEAEKPTDTNSGAEENKTEAKETQSNSETELPTESEAPANTEESVPAEPSPAPTGETP